jgi:hypothetical protein
MLYEAGYLTEDAWIKIDGLIHNGRYVFTRGPANHILDEPLMLFEDSKHEAEDDSNLQDAAVYSFKTFEKDVEVTSEEHMSSSILSDPVASTQFPSETPSESFAETSSNEGNTLLKPTEPAKKRSPDCSHKVGQERSFAGLAEAYPKFHPTCASVEGSETDSSSPELAKASNRKISVHSSLYEADAEDVTSLGGASSQHDQSWNRLYPSFPPRNPIKIDGNPGTLSDFCEANNSGLLSKRPDSRTTNPIPRTTKSPAASSSAQIANSGGNETALQLEVDPGTVLIAQSSFTKKAKVQIEVRPGDKIRVIKHVSGITHLGENFRTKQCGQFPKSVFQKSPRAPNKYTSVEKQRTITEPKAAGPWRNTRLSSSSTGNDLDKVEGMNAAEWDKDEASLATNPTLGRSSIRELVGKDSVLANAENQSRYSEPNQDEIMHAMVSKMIDEKVKRCL